MAAMYTKQVPSTLNGLANLQMCPFRASKLTSTTTRSSSTWWLGTAPARWTVMVFLPSSSEHINASQSSRTTRPMTNWVHLVMRTCSNKSLDSLAGCLRFNLRRTVIPWRNEDWATRLPVHSLTRRHLRISLTEKWQLISNWGSSPSTSTFRIRTYQVGLTSRRTKTRSRWFLTVSHQQ